MAWYNNVDDTCDVIEWHRSFKGARSKFLFYLTVNIPRCSPFEKSSGHIAYDALSYTNGDKAAFLRTFTRKSNFDISREALIKKEFSESFTTYRLNP
jgi:hypothetical protein